MHSICVWDMIKHSKPLQTRHDTTYIYYSYYIRTHVYIFLFSVKKRVIEGETQRLLPLGGWAVWRSFPLRSLALDCEVGV